MPKKLINLYPKDRNMRCLVCKTPTDNVSKYCNKHNSVEALFRPANLISSKDFAGTSPSVFVGRFGYPNISVGILSPPERREDAWLYDDTKFWVENSFEVNKIVGLRSSLLNSKFASTVKQHNNKLLDMAKEISMSNKPVDVDISLNRLPSMSRPTINDVTMPFGISAQLKKFTLESNPKISAKVEKAVYDTDLKATEAMFNLYSSGINEHSITGLLSVGNLGIGKSRKLVPTRWAITATHDSLGKRLIEEVKEFKTENYSLYFGGYLGNYFVVILFPDVWSYELFEAYVPDNYNGQELSYTTDYESNDGRKDYAENCAGGYYAARLSVLEHLNEKKRQAAALCLRFITDEYSVPLGVWVMQNACRNAMKNKLAEFSSKEETINFAFNLALKNFKVNIYQLLRKSKLMSYQNSQKKLTSYGL